ncbi:hypothetical protein Y695_02494 [Hydrogenophaga sp. T4]|nr:hypothetical protein Y695_02494 [Hydrogenophaga sp. T4]
MDTITTITNTAKPVTIPRTSTDMRATVTTTITTTM